MSVTAKAVADKTAEEEKEAVREQHLPGEDFADATVRDAELTGDVARPSTLGGELDYLLADVLRQRTAIHVHSAQLVYATVS